MRFHRAAHIGQDEQARRLHTLDFPGGLHQLATPSHAAAQGLAQIQPLPTQGQAPAAGGVRLQFGGDLAGQLLKGAQLLRHPHLAIALVQGFGAAGAPLGAGRAAVLFIQLARCRIPSGLGRGLLAVGLGVRLLRRVHLVVQRLHALAQVAAGPGLAADLDATAQFFGVPKALVHIGPQLPFAVAVAGNRTPGSLQRFFLDWPKVQGRLQHGLLLGHAHREAVVAQQRGKTRQTLRGRGRTLGGRGSCGGHAAALACSVLFSATPTVRRPSTNWRRRSGPITKRSSRVLSKQPKVPSTADMSSGKWVCRI